MPIPQIDQKHLIKQIGMVQYQKIRHSGHCSEDSNCITHCTTFGLSDSKCADIIQIVVIHTAWTVPTVSVLF